VPPPFTRMQFAISHFCVDIGQQLLLKNISKNNNYDPICYVTHNKHMYWIKDKEFIQKLSNSRVNSNYITQLNNEDEDKDDFKDIHENIPIDELDKLKDCNVIYSLSDLTELFVKLINKKKTVYRHRTSGNRIVRISYINNVVLHVDPNTLICPLEITVGIIMDWLIMH